MKKYGIFVIALMMTMTMTACMGRDDTNNTNNTGTTGTTAPMPTVITTMPTTEPVMPDTSFYPDDDGFIGETDGTGDTNGQNDPQARMRIGSR